MNVSNPVSHVEDNADIGLDIKNPISLARLVLQESTRPLTLQRVPPNLLVGEGATEFAYDQHMPILPKDFLVSPGARDRWVRWKRDLDNADEEIRANGRTPTQAGAHHTSSMEHMSPPTSPVLSRDALSPRMQDHLSAIGTSLRPLSESAADPVMFDRADAYINHSLSPPPAYTPPSRDPMIDGSDTVFGSPDETFIVAPEPHRASSPKRARMSQGYGKNDTPPVDGPSRSGDSTFEPCNNSQAGTPNTPNLEERSDMITDTVGAIAVDCFGNIAAGSSSGGIGMKHKGRVGPAALVGIGTAVIPADPEDHERASVATVTSGTGEHMATTMAAATCSERIYSRVRRKRGGGLEYATEEEALRTMLQREFMDHPGVKTSHCTGALGVLSVKKTLDGIFLYFAHNTDSFAIASMHSEEKKPVSVMSRNTGNGSIAQGGRVARHRGR